MKTDLLSHGPDTSTRKLLGKIFNCDKYGPVVVAGFVLGGRYLDIQIVKQLEEREHNIRDFCFQHSKEIKDGIWTDKNGDKRTVEGLFPRKTYIIDKEKLRPC